MAEYMDHFRLYRKKIIFYISLFFASLHGASHYYRFDSVLQKLLPCTEQTYSKSADCMQQILPQKKLEKMIIKEFIIPITSPDTLQDFEQACKNYVQTCPAVFLVEITYHCSKNSTKITEIPLFLETIVSWCVAEHIAPENIIKNIDFSDNVPENGECIKITIFVVE